MNRIYPSRINWENEPSVATPLGATNLNKVDLALYTIDGRVITLDADKIGTTQAGNFFAGVSYSQTTGVITFAKYDGTTATVDLPIEMIPADFEYDADTKELVITLKSGEEIRVDIADLVDTYIFDNSSTIVATSTTGADGKHISMSIKNNSITDAQMQTGYLSQVQQNAQISQSATATCEADKVLCEEYKDLAYQYKNEAFSGTPSGYETLVGKVNDETILTSDYGTSLALGTSKGGLGLNSIKGKSYKSSNLLKPTLATTTINGIVCTNNGDGTYTLNGTPTTDIHFSLVENLTLSAGTYKFTACQTENSNVFLYSYFGGYFNIYTETTRTLSESATSDLYLYAESGTTLSNVIVKPMITTDTSLTYDDYEPYGIISSGSLGCVDLGELTYTPNYTGRQGLFATTISGLVNTTIPLCSKFTFIDTSLENMPNYSMRFSGNNLVLKDTNYTSADTFKSSLKGVLLAYETSSTPNQYGLVVKERAEYGCVDLGSLTYATTSGGATSVLFYTQGITDGKQKAEGHYPLGVVRTDVQYPQNAWDIVINGTMYIRSNVSMTPSELKTMLKGTILYYQRADETIVDKPVIFPLSKPLCSVNSIVDEIIMQGGRWGVLRRCKIENNEVVALSTPTFEPFSDQSIPYQLVAYDTKTYLTTHENLATLSVDYSKSRVGAESLNKWTPALAQLYADVKELKDYIATLTSETETLTEVPTYNAETGGET